VRVWTGLNWLSTDPGEDPCEHSKKPSGSIKDGEFLDEAQTNSFYRTLFHDVNLYTEYSYLSVPFHVNIPYVEIRLNSKWQKECLKLPTNK
jgi:hypothetical protein